MKKKKKVENSEVVMPNDFSDFLIGVGFSIDSQSSIEELEEVFSRNGNWHIEDMAEKEGLKSVFPNKYLVFKEVDTKFKDGVLLTLISGSANLGLLILDFVQRNMESLTNALVELGKDQAPHEFLIDLSKSYADFKLFSFQRK